MSLMQPLTGAGLHAVLIVGTRPEAIKLAPVALALRQMPETKVSLWCTGQHPLWASEMLGCFGLEADLALNVSHADPGLTSLCSAMLASLGAAVAAVRPDVIVVQGDTSSAFAGALAGAYADIPVVHVEAGLRSGNQRLPFPEEAHRRAIADFTQLHCAPTQAAVKALLDEGIPEDEVLLSGNTVIDALRFILETMPQKGPITPQRRLILLTCHRRESWGAPYRAVCSAARHLARRGDCDVVFVVHPNPDLSNVAHALLAGEPHVRLVPPLVYSDFVHLLRQATLVLTDSGGIQEEAAALGTPLLVLRDTTERPEGLQVGTARLVGTTEQAIVATASEILDNPSELAGMRIPCTLYGDGNAGRRIAHAIRERWAVSMSSQPTPTTTSTTHGFAAETSPS